MAVSLVSTGVQFPDSTIQTTAASASPVTLVQSINFSGQSTFSFALDFATYPGGYELIWCNVAGSNNGAASVIEYSTNNGSSYSAFSSTSTTVKLNASTYTQALNYSGFWGYSYNSYSAGGTGNTYVMQIAARNVAGGSNPSAITMSFIGVGQNPDPTPVVGGAYYYTYRAVTFTNVRFSFSSGTFTSGSVRILGYK